MTRRFASRQVLGPTAIRPEPRAGTPLSTSLPPSNGDPALKTLILLLARLALVSFVACGAARAAEITVLYPQPYLYQQPLETIVREFMERRPDVQVRLLAPTKAYEEAASAVLRGAITRTMPDVGFQGTNLMHIFVDRGLAVPLDPFVKAEPNWDREGYIPGMVSTGVVNGTLYGLPFALSTPIMYYNADALRNAGGDPDNPPRTWPEVIALAERITEQGGPTKGLFIVWQTTGNYLWQALLFSHGGRLVTDDGKRAGFNTPAGLKTFQLIDEMVAKGGMPNLTDEQATQAFIAGQIGFYFASSARVNNLTKQVGRRFDLRTALFPVPSPDARIVSGGATMMIFTKDRDKQAAAWDFMKFAAGPLGQSIMVKNIGYLPSNQIAIDTPELLGDYYAQNANMRTSLSQLPRATRWLGFPGDNSLKAIQVVYDGIESVVTRRASPEEALSRTTTQVDALLRK